MRKIYLMLFLMGAIRCLAQNPTDTIYQVDRTKFAAIVDEVSAGEVVYFLPQDVSRLEKIRIAREKVWKIIYSNGDTEEFNSAKTLAARREEILPQTQEKPKTASPASNRPADTAQKGETVEAEKAARAPESTPVKPNEIIIKIQHETIPDGAQKDTRREYKNYVGFRFGGSMTSFYKDKIGFPGKPFYNWETGLGISLANTKHYNARLELVYANKGSRETVSEQGVDVTTRTKLTYFQGNLLPLILKAGARKLNPVIGVGGYYAYRFRHTSEYKEGDDDYQPDDITQEAIDNQFDYGLCAMLGFYSGHKPLLEFRYEHGLADVMKGLNIKNNGLSVSLFLSF
nr:porin family protein [uncultured Dyadobacter sp.]